MTVQQAVNMTRHKTGMSALAAYFGDQVSGGGRGHPRAVSCPQVLDRKVRLLHRRHCRRARHDPEQEALRPCPWALTWPTWPRRRA